MKRSAAILGPTPQFVRWAIEHPCPFREIEPDDLANKTFGQLRSLRALAEGIRDDRVFERICVHESVEWAQNADDVANARGFLIDEIYALFGEKGYIQECCGRCPANAVDYPMGDVRGGAGDSWAGCFGSLPADPGWNSNSRSLTDTNPILVDLVDCFDKSIQKVEKEFQSCFSSSPTNWYGLWMPHVLGKQQITVLSKMFADVADMNSLELAENRPFNQMFDAINRCEVNRFRLHVELVPPGYSDGISWEIFAHCPLCHHVAIPPNRDTCIGCGRRGKPVHSRFQKVLGFRPFLLLRHVLGNDKTISFVTRYLSTRKP